MGAQLAQCEGSSPFVCRQMAQLMRLAVGGDSASHGQGDNPHGQDDQASHDQYPPKSRRARMLASSVTSVSW